MYQIAKSSRTKLKNKARQMAMASNQKVDSSDWTPAEPLNADIKTGMRPVSRRAFKKGGKVMGECSEPRADRKPRKAGGRLVAKEIAEAKVNRNVKEANELRPGGKAHVGGYKKGGRAHKFAGGAEQVPNAKPDPKMQQKMSATPKGDAGDTSKMPQPSDMYDDKGEALERGHNKWGGRTKKMFGGPMGASQGPMAMVKPKRMEFAGNPVTPGQKRGGKVERHPDEAMDKALIKKMVKPSARTGKAGGGESMLTGIGPMIGTDDEDAAVKGMLGVAAGKKAGGRAKRATGGQVFSGPGYPGKVPGVIGGRKAHAAGGKAGKGKTNINIVIAGPKGDEAGMPPKGMPPQLPQRMPVPAPAPAGGMPMGAGAAMPMPPMPPVPAGGAPMGAPTPRKHGGRLTKVASSYKDMEAGSGGGEGRLQKTDIAKKGKGAPTFKRGGKVYRSYKDMDAGAGSGEGRLEKSEIQHTKRVH